MFHVFILTPKTGNSHRIKLITVLCGYQTSGQSCNIWNVRRSQKLHQIQSELIQILSHNLSQWWFKEESFMSTERPRHSQYKIKQKSPVEPDLGQTGSDWLCYEWSLCWVWLILPPPAQKTKTDQVLISSTLWDKNHHITQRDPAAWTAALLSYQDSNVGWVDAFSFAVDLDLKCPCCLAGSIAGRWKLHLRPGQLQSAGDTQLNPSHTQETDVFEPHSWTLSLVKTSPCVWWIRFLRDNSA